MHLLRLLKSLNTKWNKNQRCVHRKSLIYSKHELFKVDLDNKNRPVMNSNLIKLSVE